MASSKKLETVDLVVEKLSDQGLIDLGKEKWHKFIQNTDSLSMNIQANINTLHIESENVVIEDTQEL